MKKILFTLVTIVCIGTLQAASQTEEQALAALQNSKDAQKKAAILTLKQTGTAKSVSALSALLSDENYAQWAIDALQTMPAPEAGKALLKAMPSVSGKTKAMVVYALGARHEKSAGKEMRKALEDADPMIAAAAAQALASLGDNDAVPALRKACANSNSAVATAANNALLTIADRLLANGKTAEAKTIYAEMHSGAQPQQLRTAAFRGLVLSAGDKKSELIAAALTGTDPDEQAMAIQLVRDLPDQHATALLGDVLPKVPSAVQIAVLEALRQRSDPAGAVAVGALTTSSDIAVRLASIRTLGELGDASSVKALAELAANTTGDEQGFAREALASLHRGEVLDKIISELKSNRIEVQLELVRALARRMDRRATPELLQLAVASNSKLAIAATKALEQLATDDHAAGLLDLVVKAKDEPRREAAISAFVVAAGRSRNSANFSSMALKAASGASTDIRCALLEAAGQIGGPEVLEALRAALKDSDPDVREAALRTLAENGTTAALPDLLVIARTSTNSTYRTQAMQGYWRLVEGLTDRSQAERLSAVREGFAVAKTSADRKLGLSRLAQLQSKEALEIAQSFMQDKNIRNEAEVACYQIATRIEPAQLATAEKVLHSLAAEAENERVRTDAQTAVKQLEGQGGYVAPWLVIGPYQKKGKDAKALFEIAFAPEKPNGKKLEWRPLAGGATLTDYWRLDLLPVAGGNDRVVYIKTKVFSPKEQPVGIEVGTDDGVKLWINGTLVHANNAVRGFTPDEDKAKGTLKEGWNDFLVKVTQSTAGCAASVRLRGADGKGLPGLRVEARE